MGKYDIPAIINFIRASSGRDKLIYIGYSMGVCTFFIAMITHPELNSKIEIMIAMGPAVSMAHVSSPIFRSLAPAVRGFEVWQSGSCWPFTIQRAPLKLEFCVRLLAVHALASAHRQISRWRHANERAQEQILRKELCPSCILSEGAFQNCWRQHWPFRYGKIF